MSGSERSSFKVTGLRLRPIAWLAVPFVALLQFVTPVALGVAPAAQAATAQSSAPFALKVVSARTVGGASPIVKGHDVLGSTTLTAPDADTNTTTTSYKWMITADDNGNPADSNANCLPVVIDPKTGAPEFNPDGTPKQNTLYSPGTGSYGTWNTATQRYEDANGAPFDASKSCQWPSARYTAGAMGILDEGEVHETAQTGDKTPGSLPPGKYLVSVIAGGYKIDGSHFTVSDDGKIHNANGDVVTTVTVAMQPYPLPLGTLRLQVFKDIAPVDSTYEADAEPGLAGFTTHLNDVLGEVTTDFYGNRLCTNYVHTATLPSTDPNYTPAGGTPPAGYSRSNYDILSPVVFDGGLPVIDLADPGGKCLSDAAGLVAIPNLGPNRYTATVIPPSGQDWYQTTTLEGNHDWDMWIHEGDTGFDHELTVGGEPVPPVDMGYVPFGTSPGAAAGTVVPKYATVASGTATPGAAGAVTLTFGSNAPSTAPPAGQVVTLQQPVLVRYRINNAGFLRTAILAGDQTVFASSGSSITLRLALPANATNITVSAGARVTMPDAAPARVSTAAGVKGQVVELNAYVGGKGGVNVPTADQLAGTNVRGPVDTPIVALSDLNNNDQMVWVGRGDKDGKFLANVPNGSYQITFWDYNQDLIINSVNVDVKNGAVTDMGQQGLVDWYTDIKGKIYVDSNGNGTYDCAVPGSKDPSQCEQGVPKFAVTFKERDNSLFDAGQNLTTSDDNGDYEIREGYPVTRWGILEAFNTRYKTTGISVKADNEPTPTLYKGAAVDVNVLPIIGLSGRVDWGVQPYAGAETGGIAGTVTYDTTRNELDAKFAFTEDYQPGIPNMLMHLYYPVRDANGGVVKNADGSVKVVTDPSDPSKPLEVASTYTSETWEQPKGCTARMQDGQPLTDQLALPPFGNDDYQCVEAPMMGWQAVPSDKTADNFGQTVNGNYAFAATDYDPAELSCLASLQGGDPTVTSCDPLAAPSDGAFPMGADDWVVKADSPKLPDGTPMYKPTSEEDINVFDGDVRMPQENYPLAAGDLLAAGSAVSVPGQGGPVSQQGGIWFDCAGKNHTVHVTDQGFLNAGGSPFEGLDQPLCDAKLISTRGNQTVAPNFNFFTDVPLPTHFWGLTINDLGISHDKTQLGFGEAEPLPNVPMGIYDWSGRLVDTVMTDHNGMYEATEPSTSSYNCPLPAGPCPGMYYFKGNDPGQPGRPNKDYNPRFRTIGTDFQAWPGLFTVTDTAPTQTSAIAITPDGAIANPVACDVNAGVTDPANATPDIYAVDSPYVVSKGLDANAHPAQQLAVSRVTTTGTGTTRTATLTIPSTNLQGLTSVNVALTQGTTAMNAALFAALNGPHTLTTTPGANPVTTLTYQVTVPAATLNVTNYAPGSASVVNTPAYQYHPAGQTVTISGTVTATGATSPRTVTLPFAAGAIDPAAQLTTVTLPILAAGATNPALSLLNRLALAGSKNVTGLTSTSVSLSAAVGAFSAATTGGGFQVTLGAYTTPLAATGPSDAATVTISGAGFGSAPGTVSLTAPAGVTSNITPTVAAGAWTDTKITVSLATPNGAAPTPAPYQLSVTGSNKRQSVNGLTLHVLGTGYNPRLFQVNPDVAHGADSTGRNFGYKNGSAGDWETTSVVDDQYDAAGTYTAAENVVQRALDAARASAPSGNSTAPAPLVVVWPKDVNRTPSTNATGDYYENLVIGAAVKLQGVGTGGFQGSGTTATYVPGTRLNGLGFNADNLNGTQWINTVTSYGPDPATIPDGATITVLGNGNSTTGGSFTTAGSTANRRPSVDGVTITGGDEGGAGLANQNTLNGANTTPVGGTGVLSSQGGGVYLFGGANNVQISNNHIDGNSGAYAGGVRVGTPYTASTTTGSTPSNWANTNISISHNRITSNGGTNLAGGIGLFDGSSNYAIDHNDICGNFSSEYGGGISHYGRSDSGSITFNRVYLNQSYDEGGGVMIAGELNPNLNQPSLGAASPTSTMTIDGNLVQDNLANDDGGGIRFLSAGRVRIDVTNNSVVDNISTHEGGGFALDDSVNVRIVGNTVMKNLSTASAITSNGFPAPAGLSTANNSTQLQNTLPAGSALYSKPVLIDNIFADNRAGTFDSVTGEVHGIGMPGDAAPVNVWDIGSGDNVSANPMTPTYSVLTSTTAGGNNSNLSLPASANNATAPSTLTDLVISPFDVGVSVQNTRTNPGFRQSIIISKLAAPQLLGDYHLKLGGTSVAIDKGQNQSPTYPNYGHDIDNQGRPHGAGYDIGSDES